MGRRVIERKREKKKVKVKRRKRESEENTQRREDKIQGTEKQKRNKN